MRLPAHLQGTLDLGHAGALFGLAVDLHQAVLAHTHAAEHAARRLIVASPKRQLSGSSLPNEEMTRLKEQPDNPNPISTPDDR